MLSAPLELIFLSCIDTDARISMIICSGRERVRLSYAAGWPVLIQAVILLTPNSLCRRVLGSCMLQLEDHLRRRRRCQDFRHHFHFRGHQSPNHLTSPLLFYHSARMSCMLCIFIIAIELDGDIIICRRGANFVWQRGLRKGLKLRLYWHAFWNVQLENI